jgi:outer membrane protein assembly factor BamA
MNAFGEVKGQGSKVKGLRSKAPLTFALLLLTYVAHPASAQTSERIAEVRVHGNHTTPEADILALAGLATGADASEARLRDAERKLRDTGRFEGVELRRRYLSIADPSQILVMIVVDEHPAVSASNLTPGPFKKLAAAQMWLPILHHDDGYGLTYGARVSFVDVLGDRSRVSVPMSWGGERRIALEAERAFDGPISIVRGAVFLNRRVNPHFEMSDRREEARVEAERIITPWLRAGVNARVAQVHFGPAYEARHNAAGVQGTIDTRIDPSFPRNAIHAKLGWERLFFSGDGSPLPGAGRARADARGFIGIGGSTVLALRGQLVRAGSALPAAEQSLLGGSDSVRGYRTGHRAGDNLAAATIEVRQPLNSPLSVGRFGVKAFVDAGTTWNAGGKLDGQPFDRGIGGGVYFGGGPFMMDLDLAWPRDGSPRAHFGLGVTF